MRSERKWKDKLKEWGFKKHVPATEMAFMVAKAEKGKLEDGKDTIFHRNGMLVEESKIEQLKKRRLNDGTYVVPGESRKRRK